MPEYIPSPRKWVADQVELYEGSNGEDGTTLRETGLPVIIVTNRGWKTDAIRNTPLMKVSDGGRYVLVASQGGAAKNPLWYYNLKANSNVDIQDGSKVHSMEVKEVPEGSERDRLWAIAVQAYPPYEEYQQKTNRLIPVFIATLPD